MMVDAGGGFAGEEIVRCCPEELHHRGVFEGRGVRDVDNDRGPSQRFGQTRAGDDVDSGAT
jgi:hypothetical protein